MELLLNGLDTRYAEYFRVDVRKDLPRYVLGYGTCTSGYTRRPCMIESLIDKVLLEISSLVTYCLFFFPPEVQDVGVVLGIS